MTPQPELVTRIAENLAQVRERIAAAGGGSDVEIVAVTKTFPASVVDAAVAAGCTAIGENYAQELVAKWAEVSSRPRLHFVGRLQSNKVRVLAPIVDVWETLDRPSLIAELARRAPGARVLVQVNTTGEADKGGCPPADALALAEHAAAAGLDVAGMMTVGPTGLPPAAAAPGFAEVRALVDRAGLSVCSMGMTGDLEVAVAEGATEVRLGTALLGPRS